MLHLNSSFLDPVCIHLCDKKKISMSGATKPKDESAHSYEFLDYTCELRSPALHLSSLSDVHPFRLQQAEATALQRCITNSHTHTHKVKDLQWIFSYMFSVCEMNAYLCAYMCIFSIFASLNATNPVKHILLLA